MFLDKKFEKRLVTMLLRTNENSKDALLTIISPLGTLIQSGVRISLDNEQLNEKAYGFIFCKKDGCFTSTIIKKEKIELFKKSKALKLEYTMDNQQTLNIGLDLKGFTKAFDKITICEIFSNPISLRDFDLTASADLKPPAQNKTISLLGSNFPS